MQEVAGVVSGQQSVHTVAHFLSNIPDFTYTAGESFLFDLFMTMVTVNSLCYVYALYMVNSKSGRAFDVPRPDGAFLRNAGSIEPNPRPFGDVYSPASSARRWRFFGGFSEAGSAHIGPSDNANAPICRCKLNTILFFKTLITTNYSRLSAPQV